jgi:anti-sigma factor RsiW
MHGDTPVSFCIIKSGKPEQDMKSERREGLNIVHWQGKGHGYMIIGDVPDNELSAIARRLKQQMS